MNVLRRLYRYLGRYKGWAIVAFGSMIVFAMTQTVMIALTQPLFDQVLTPPGATHVQTHDSTTKQRVLQIILKRDRPEGQRGWFINTYDRTSKRFDTW